MGTASSNRTACVKVKADCLLNIGKGKNLRRVAGSGFSGYIGRRFSKCVFVEPWGSGLDHLAKRLGANGRVGQDTWFHVSL